MQRKCDTITWVIIFLCTDSKINSYKLPVNKLSCEMKMVLAIKGLNNLLKQPSKRLSAIKKDGVW